jgi:hypothetical protein
MGKGSGSGRGAQVVNPALEAKGLRHTAPDSTDAVHSGHYLIRIPVPRGLRNVGNTCYANAVLQCLLSTALRYALLHPCTVPVIRRYSSNPIPLTLASASLDSTDEESREQTAFSRERRRKETEDTRMLENCRWLTRELTNLTRDYTAEDPAMFRKSDQSNNASWGWLGTSLINEECTLSVVDPGSITLQPNRLSKCLRPYQQEDAHEFLRALLGTLVMNGHNKKMSSLFDGLLESAVTCQTCFHSSLTRDRYMDLSLDICGKDTSTLPAALAEFTKTEVLDGENLVQCQKCAAKRQVTKGLRLATAPSILVCHLKRFAFDEYGRTVRLHKHVAFPLKLEIGDYMSRVNKSTPPPYEVVGVVVHQGATCDSGHYLAYVKCQDDWYKCNDSEVTKVDVETVLNQRAYILIYEVAGMRDKDGDLQQRLIGIHKAAMDSSRQVQKEDDFSTSYSRASDGSRFRQADPSLFSFQNLLCGAAYGGDWHDIILRDFCFDMCHRTPKPTRSKRSRTRTKASSRRRPHDTDSISRRPHETDSVSHNNLDDLTLGDSTVESSDTSKLHPMRKSSSSGNLKDYEKPGSWQSLRSQIATSAPRARPRTHSYSSSDPGVNDSVIEPPTTRKATSERPLSTSNQRWASMRAGELPPLPVVDPQRRTLSATSREKLTV